jgi:hypothetical protein
MGERRRKKVEKDIWELRERDLRHGKAVGGIHDVTVGVASLDLLRITRDDTQRKGEGCI